MFQALSNLLFGEVEEVAAELKGPKPCVTEADEEGWMLVNLPGESDPTDLTETENAEAPLPPPPRPHSSPSQSHDSNRRTVRGPPTDPPSHKRRILHKGQASSDPLCRPNARLSDSDAVAPVTRPRRARFSRYLSPPSMSPGSGSECGGSRVGSTAGTSDRGYMDESWFVTPPPCFTAEGATAESSPMEDLLIEHPSMSVYVSPSNMSMVSTGNLSTVAEESVASLAGSLSRMTKSAASPATRSTKTARGSRGSATQAGILAKVTRVARVQRGKALIERRHLSSNRIQRQNRTKEKAPCRGAHIRNSFLHQPNKRNFYH